jgi:glutathione-specific gamma-glutamylcyclotransferase
MAGRTPVNPKRTGPLPGGMSLTREDLENGRMRRLLAESGRAPRLLTDEELDASIRCVLAGVRTGEDLWVFGYGSLLWNPLLDHDERRPATLRGFHRRFCLWSTMGRGSPECPGLVLGLDLGGSCHGLAYRLPAASAAGELRLLWRREMVSGSYFPRWVRIEAAPCAASHGCKEELRALAFVVNREHPNYAGRLPIDKVVRALADACGHIGSSADYLHNTVAALAAHGLRDVYLERLTERLAREAAPK